MTWTRLDDGWTDRLVLEQLPYEVRWHYLALIQFCSRTARYDGLVRVTDARRCSDVPDPAAANAALVDVGLLLVAENSAFRLTLIQEHVPPPHLRDETRKQSQRERKRRERAHRAGNHELCHTETCHKAPPVTSDVTRDTGTGQDGPGRENRTEDETNDWSEVHPPGSGLRSVPDSPLSDETWASMAAGYDR